MDTVVDDASFRKLQEQDVPPESTDLFCDSDLTLEHLNFYKRASRVLTKVNSCADALIVKELKHQIHRILVKVNQAIQHTDSLYMRLKSTDVSFKEVVSLRNTTAKLTQQTSLRLMVACEYSQVSQIILPQMNSTIEEFKAKLFSVHETKLSAVSPSITRENLAKLLPPSPADPANPFSPHVPLVSEQSHYIDSTLRELRGQVAPLEAALQATGMAIEGMIPRLRLEFSENCVQLEEQFSKLLNRASGLISQFQNIDKAFTRDMWSPVLKAAKSMQNADEYDIDKLNRYGQIFSDESCTFGQKESPKAIEPTCKLHFKFRRPRNLPERPQNLPESPSKDRFSLQNTLNQEKNVIVQNDAYGPELCDWNKDNNLQGLSSGDSDPELDVKESDLFFTPKVEVLEPYKLNNQSRLKKPSDVPIPDIYFRPLVFSCLDRKDKSRLPPPTPLFTVRDGHTEQNENIESDTWLTSTPKMVPKRPETLIVRKMRSTSYLHDSENAPMPTRESIPTPKLTSTPLCRINENESFPISRIPVSVVRKSILSTPRYNPTTPLAQIHGYNH